MIFITLGSQKFQFNRLLKAVDLMLENAEIKTEAFAQIGYSDYRPRNFKYKRFLNRSEYGEMIDKADIVITHGGTGAIIGAVKKGKRVVAMPRLAKYGEHVDNHQTQLLSQFDELNLIVVCEDESRLSESVQDAKSRHFNVYQSNTKVIIDSIDTYLRTLNVNKLP